MSGRKSNLYPFKSLASISMSSDVVSSASNIQFLDNVGMQFNYTGAPVGTLKVQISADYNQDTNGNILNVGSWTTITASSVTALAGTTYFDLNQISPPWVRGAFTALSGSGVLSCYVTAKMV